MRSHYRARLCPLLQAVRWPCSWRPPPLPPPPPSPTPISLRPPPHPPALFDSSTLVNVPWSTLWNGKEF